MFELYIMNDTFLKKKKKIKFEGGWDQRSKEKQEEKIQGKT